MDRRLKNCHKNYFVVGLEEICDLRFVIYFVVGVEEICDLRFVIYFVVGVEENCDQILLLDLSSFSRGV